MDCNIFPSILFQLDFDPGSEDSDSSNDSGQGREEIEEAPSVTRNHLTPSPLHLFAADHALHLPDPTRPPALMQTASESRRTSQASGRCFSSGDPEPNDSGDMLPVSKADLDLPLLSINSVSFEGPARHVTLKETSVQNNNQPREERNAVKVSTEPPTCLSCLGNVPPDGRSQPFLSGRTKEALAPLLQQEDTASISTTVHSAPLTSPADDGQLALVSLPRSKSLNSSFASCLSTGEEDGGRFLRLLSREAALLLLGRENCNISGPLSRLSLAGTNTERQVHPSHLVLAPRAMIWTEKEACRKHVAQIGTSACGATALVNVALALNLEVSLNDVAKAVRTRLRREQSDLPDYLFSRAEAGCTHEDLLQGMRLIGQNRVVGRFFPMYGRQVALHTWLATWITRGCVPVATLNPQRSELRLPSPPQHSSPGCLQQPPLLADAWHHQMIFGVTGREIYLTNPLEVLSEDVLRPQLDSPSELLIRREDIIARFSKSTDLTQLVRPTVPRWRSDRRWHDYNVMGQVANVLREERSKNLSECENVCLTPFVKIPASYRSGITLFCDAMDAELVCLLHAAPEFSPLDG